MKGKAAPLRSFEEIETLVADLVRISPEANTNGRKGAIMDRVLVALFASGSRGMTRKEMILTTGHAGTSIDATLSPLLKANPPAKARVEKKGTSIYRLSTAEQGVQEAERSKRLVSAKARAR